MTFFESLLLLMLVAIALLQVARRLSLPYPAMLAGAGLILAFIPGTPVFNIDPETYLALFIAPVLVDAAFDFPPGAMSRLRVPLLLLAVFGVVLTAGAVAWMAHSMLGVTLAAGLALGGIVAPPDAAAASAVLRGISIPRNTSALLQGESLFNDSTALLLFSAGLAVVNSNGLHPAVALRLALAVPGGILFGMGAAWIALRANRYAQGTLGGNLLQFVMAYAVWIIAARLQLSAVLATVTFAMTLARTASMKEFTARSRIQSYAVWSAVVFALNALAFMLMGLQARSIVRHMASSSLRGALLFAAEVTLAVIVIRMLVVLLYYFLYARRRPQDVRPTLQQIVFVGWCGMRGFVTMATALSLPNSFPQRDTLVLTAFSVVIVTLVLQGATLAPVIRLLKLDRMQDPKAEVAGARTAIARAALDSIAARSGPEAENLRYHYTVMLDADSSEACSAALRRMRAFGLHAIVAKRKRLEELRDHDEISVETYLGLQEQIDWGEMTMLADEDRKIEEI